MEKTGRRETQRYIKEVRELSGKHIGMTDNFPKVVGFIGDMWAEDLTDNQIVFLKRYYGVEGNAPHKILSSFPVEKMTSASGKTYAVSHGRINNYIQFE